MNNRRLALSKHPTRRPIIEEVEDETWEAHRRKPKALNHILESMDNINDPLSSQDEAPKHSRPAKEASESRQALSSEKQPECTEAVQPLEMPDQVPCGSIVLINYTEGSSSMKANPKYISLSMNVLWVAILVTSLGLALPSFIFLVIIAFQALLFFSLFHDVFQMMKATE